MNASSIIALLALVVAAASATFTGLTYRLNSQAARRRAPQIRTMFGSHLPTIDPDAVAALRGDPLEVASQQDDTFCLAVRAHNAGDTPIDVVQATVRLREVDSDYGWSVMPLAGTHGPQLPFTLTNNAGTWWVPLLSAQSVPQQHPSDARRLRGDVEVTFELVLATGEVILEGPRHIRFLRPGIASAL